MPTIKCVLADQTVESVADQHQSGNTVNVNGILPFFNSIMGRTPDRLMAPLLMTRLQRSFEVKCPCMLNVEIVCYSKWKDQLAYFD